MRIKNRTGLRWKHLPIISFIGLALWIVLQFDAVFEQKTNALLALLPLAWWSLNANFSTFQSDRNVVTPKNIILFIWLNKLLIIPMELIFMGNKITRLNPKNQPIHLEIIILLVSCAAFGFGWQSNLLKSKTQELLPIRTAKPWAILYISIALVSLLLLYGSLSAYWAGAIFTYATREALEQAGGTFIGFFANVGQRFWVFGLILAWYLWSRNYRASSRWYWHLPWLFLCIAGTLNSNRVNMIVPFLTFASVMCAQWKAHRKWWIVAIAFGSLFLMLFYGHIRVQPLLDGEIIQELFRVYVDDKNYIWSAHQLYFGTPYQISPLLNDPNSSFTLWASVLDPIPILGKAFREQSGPYIYNSAINNPSQDQVIPVAGELYYNSGFLLVAIGHFLFGIAAHWFDTVFKKYSVSNPSLAAAFFYLALLFNATLMLSLSVSVQFALYNAAPALLLIGINCRQMRKAS
ncbi:MAG: hypothetical protein U0X91_06785 [Spirosomataceae bacterium]